MRIALAVFIMVLIAVSANAVIETRAEVIRGYNACLLLLKLPAAQQAAAARRAGHSLEMILSSCQFEKRKGLAYMIRENQRYYWELHHPSHPSTPVTTPVVPDNSCYNTSNCSLGDQCLSGQCVHAGPGGGECDNGAHECAPDETCINGLCHF